MPNLIKLPNKLKIKTTSSGYSYTNLDINVKCDFKGTEPSPKGFGLCARMVLEGNHAKGTDGNIWVKKGGRWVKDNSLVKGKTKIPKQLKNKTKKSSELLKVKKQNESVQKVDTNYSSIGEWRKKSKMSKKFNKMVTDFKKGKKWNYKLTEQYNLEEMKQYAIFDKKNNVNKKKFVKSDALKIHDEIYKVWDKLAKKSVKLHGYKEYFIPNPQFHNISKAKSFKHNIKTTNDNGVSLYCDCGPNTGDKYLNYESCISNSRPKTDCNKYIKMLNKDLTNIQKAHTLSIKQNKPIDKKHIKSKKKKQTKSEALKLHDEIYKIWEKVAKKSKKLYDDEEYFIAHPDGLAWGYGAYAKYLDWELCLAESKPKRECNKIVTMLKQDLKKMNKALEKVNKPVKAITKKTPVKKICKTNEIFNYKTGKCIKDLNKQLKTIKKSLKIANKQYKNSKLKSLWNVKKQGVMLAHTFKDTKSGKIKSPPKGYPKAPDGWYLSEKYDGYRAIWNGKDFVSRNGIIFRAPDWFKEWLPNNVALDGELFIGRELIN